MGHVGSSKQPIPKRSCDQSRDILVTDNKATQLYNTKKLGTDSLAQIIYEEKAFKKPI